MRDAPDLAADRNATAFLTGGGAMGRLVRAHDWVATPLGSPDHWPPSLRTAVGMVLNSRFPAALVWGQSLVTIYNDAFRPILGQKPEALGRSFAEVWSEAWAEIGPIAKRAFQGEATYIEDFPLTVERNGYPEQAYFTFCYSPVRDEAGRVVGFLDTVIETTRRIRAEAALTDSEAQLRFLSELDEALRTSDDAPAAMEAAAGVLARRLGASRCAYADVDPDTDRFIIRSDYAAPGITTSAGTYSLDLFGPRAAADMRSGRTLVVRDVAGELAPAEGAEMFQAIGIGAIVCCPLVKEGRLVAMMAVHQDCPRDWRHEEISVVEAVVERCWAHVQRVGAEARLRESEGQFQAIANSVDQMIWSTRPDGYHDYFNDRWYEYTGVPYGSTDAQAWSGMFHPDDREMARRVWSHSLDTGQPYHIEYRLRHRSGQYRWVIGRAQCVRDRAGRISRWFGTCTDVHDLKVAEERLREWNDTLERRVADRTGELAESQRRFRGIFDSALQFMALLTPAGTVVEVNQTALEWSQITPADIVGKPFWLAAPMRGNPELQADVRAGIERAAAGEIVRAEHEMRGAGEVRAVVDFSLKPVPGERGEPIWLVAEGRDITELKRAQDALRQAQKLEAVGQLTGGVAHDFNNLLTIIKSSTDLLKKPGLAEERRRRYVDAIADTVDRASKLTGQLLAFARRQALKPEVFDPAERVRSITDMLRTIVGAPIRIAIEIGCEGCHVEADASQFETALVNMAVNARDAMNGEGRLTVRVGEVSGLPAIRGHGGGPGRFVAVSLTDSGCGIPSDKLDQIFEPFFTTKAVGKGTGLGLSQVFGFAKQSGGDVAVQSELGQGTTFTLYLPRVEGDHARDRSNKEQRASGIEEYGHGRRVLVVEDNVEVGRFSTQILHDLGYETTWAANGDEALKVLSEANGFDAVFSDVVMPGMSGVELGLEIRRRYPGLPVVLTSGYSHVLAEEGRHGFELIHKPYAAEELSRVLRRVTRTSQATS
jgi:PAS domain S-box-containing protein